MWKVVAAGTLLLLSSTDLLRGQPAESRGGEPTTASRGLGAVPVLGVAEPTSCTLRTCHLALERSWPTPVLRRGLPGTPITEVAWTLGEVERAMASNPEAVAVLRGAKRGRLLSVLAVAVSVPVAISLARASSDGRELPPSVPIVGGFALLAGLAGEHVWFNRIDEAIRIYNAGLPDTPPE